MWIIIDESIAQISADSHLQLQGLETLLLSIARGEHALAVKRGIAEILYGLPLSAISKATLLGAAQRAAEFLSKSSAAQYKAYIHYDNVPFSKISDSEWRISIDFLALNGMPMSAILAENLTDAEIYEYSAHHYRALAQERFHFKIARLGGGGADTPKTLASEINQKTWFIFCLTDSDKLSPIDSANQTSRECSRIVERAAWVARHLVLEEREAENHVPKTLIQDTLELPPHRDSWERFQKIEALNISDTQWKYLDLKEGTSLKKCFGNKQFWIDPIKTSVLHALSIAECENLDACPSNAEKPCSCVVCPGISKKILENVLGYLQQNSVHVTARRAKTSANIIPWLETGKAICDWGAALERRRI